MKSVYLLIQKLIQRVTFVAKKKVFNLFGEFPSLREKYPNTCFFLVRILPYSLQIWENTEQRILRIWIFLRSAC